MNVLNKTVTISGPSAAYPALDAPNVRSTFQGRVSVVLMTAGEIYVSLDGINDHAHLVSGTPAVSCAFESNAYQRVWIRVISSGSVSVQTIIETVR
jgi:hypothetical protein